MHRDEARSRSRLLLVLAFLSLLLAIVWSVRSPPAANSDRYDYVGRAYQATRGHGLSPLVVYPLRLALPDAGDWPPPNLSRPPLWPALLVPGVQAGLGDRAGVVLAALCAAGLVWLMSYVGDRSFAPGAGGMAALAFVASFTTVRGLWGGGPELAMALLTFLLWTWSPALHGSAGYVACGTLYGLLALLHPTGWFVAVLAFAARSHRYSDRGRILVAGAALLVGAPWYLQWWAQTGAPAGFLQGQAELARSVLDPGGLGPYRTLEPMATGEVLREELGAVLRTGVVRAKDHLLHLDAWLSWPLVALTLLGFRRDPHLAIRDLVVLGIGFLGLGFWSAESRLLLPLLPVVCAWSGAGFVALTEHGRRLPWILIAAVVVAAPWVVPTGLALRPGAELESTPPELLRPPPAVVDLVGAAGVPEAPMFTDSAALAWRARRSAVFLPDTPVTLARLRDRPVLRHADVIVLGRGRKSRWTAEYRAAWDSLIARSTILRDEDSYLVLRLASSAPSEPSPEPTSRAEPAPTVPETTSALPEPNPVDRDPVGPERTLGPDYAPADLVEIPVPPATRPDLRLRAPALTALLEMVEGARRDGVELRVLSGFRPYSYQKGLYDRAIARHGEDQRWVAPPGQSEHQLGTAVDLADGELRYVLEPEFGQTPEGLWVAARAAEFGFVITYTEENAARRGILPEPWHVRYLGVSEDEPVEDD